MDSDDPSLRTTLSEVAVIYDQVPISLIVGYGSRPRVTATALWLNAHNITTLIETAIWILRRADTSLRSYSSWSGLHLLLGMFGKDDIRARRLANVIATNVGDCDLPLLKLAFGCGASPFGPLRATQGPAVLRAAIAEIKASCADHDAYRRRCSEAMELLVSSKRVDVGPDSCYTILRGETDLEWKLRALNGEHPNRRLRAGMVALEKEQRCIDRRRAELIRRWEAAAK